MVYLTSSNHMGHYVVSDAARHQAFQITVSGRTNMVAKTTTARSPEGSGDAQALVQQSAEQQLAACFRAGYQWLVSWRKRRCPYNPKEPAHVCATCQAHPVKFTFRDNGEGSFFPPHGNQLRSMCQALALEVERIMTEDGCPIRACAEPTRCRKNGCATH